MYPLVIILAIGILTKDRKLPQYVLPLAIVGWGIAAYHNLLYYNIIPESVGPCQAGVSCTTKFISWFGFVTIPFLSFIAFTVIISCLTIVVFLQKKQSSNPS
jgi:disulfide bond formation protein DsbB